MSDSVVPSPSSSSTQSNARRGIATTVPAVLLATLLAACGGSGDTAEPEADPGSPATGQTGGTGGEQSSSPSASGSPNVEESIIVMSDFAYSVPATVPAGATVTVRNEDAVAHTVTSDEPGVFDVAVDPGQEMELTVPDSAGDYPFHCTPHPNMTATLVVE
jgi:plastocyanin